MPSAAARQVAARPRHRPGARARTARLPLVLGQGLDPHVTHLGSRLGGRPASVDQDIGWSAQGADRVYRVTAKVDRREDRAFTTDEDPQYGVVGGPEGDEIVAILVGDPLYAGIELTGEQVPLSEVRLLAPVIPRSKVACIGRNYAAHAAELGNDVPEEPLVFLKPNTSVDRAVRPHRLPAPEQRRPVRGRACRRHRAGSAVTFPSSGSAR